MKCLFNFPNMCIALAATASTTPISSKPLASVSSKRQSSDVTGSSLTVDLGYEVYRGYYDSGSGLNSWKGIRYAAPPIGDMRWQAPQTPAMNRARIIQANTFAPRCPQAPSAPLNPGGDYSGDEDCLFLNVYSPQNATNLPVLVWIHGGGYGQGKGDMLFSPMINANNNTFIGIAIQYRLAAFGFLSSDEVHQYGVANAGLLDQTFALQWIQKYVHIFGGDPSQVTISGQSAGGGSVMLQSMAYGGSLKDSLFKNLIAVSPFLPEQYGYADAVPTQYYNSFAKAVGCFPSPIVNSTIFQCLQNTSTTLLQAANVNVSSSGRFGTWTFLPVTDGTLVQQRPSAQLPSKNVNGLNMLTGNNANEGPQFVPQNITTQDDFIAFAKLYFPLFDDDDITALLQHYPSTTAPVDPTIPRFATSGTSGATALNESTYGTGQQQRAMNLYAESTFVCPSYWLAEGFSGNGRKSYKYQYSIIGASHGEDLGSYTGIYPGPFLGPDFVKASETIWGNFITTSNPSISPQIAGGTSQPPTYNNPITHWPPYTPRAPRQINMNQTGGVPYDAGTFNGQVVTQFENPGLRNAFSLVDAAAWEGGRGERCEWLQRVGVRVPD